MAQSLLLVGQIQSQVKAEAIRVATEQSSTFDTTVFDARENRGIDSVRELLSTSFRKPFNSKLLTLIILQADKLTVEAQNSLLKLLEEPPEETQIILTAQNRSNLLPTVVSRCLEIAVKGNAADQTAKTGSFEEESGQKFSEKLEFFEKRDIERYLVFLQKQLESVVLDKRPHSDFSLKELSTKTKFALKLAKAGKSSANKKLLALLLALNWDLSLQASEIIC